MRKALYFLLTIITLCAAACGGSGDKAYGDGDSAADSYPESKPTPDATAEDIIRDNGADPRWEKHLDSMPDHGCVKLRVCPPPGPLRKSFLDSNYLHVAAGEQYGITPIESPDDVWRQKRRLVQIHPCAEYFVDSLTHSYPYLIPEAARLLSDIGRAFNDSLRARGGGSYRLKVTSVLRTTQSVARLRRVNRVAVEKSSHCYGTSFDISYIKFICDAETVNRTSEDLKNLLAEIIYDFKQRGRCLAIFERSQSCFHLTYIDKNYRRPLPPPEDDEDKD